MSDSDGPGEKEPAEGGREEVEESLARQEHESDDGERDENEDG